MHMFITGIFLTAVGGVIWLPTIMSKVDIKQLSHKIREHRDKVFRENYSPNEGYSMRILNLPRRDRKEVIKTIDFLREIRNNLTDMEVNADTPYFCKLLNIFGDYTSFELWGTNVDIKGAEEGVINTIINYLKNQPDIVIKLDHFQDLLLAYQDAFKKFYELHSNNPLASLDELLDDYTDLYEVLTKLHIEIIKEFYRLQKETKYQPNIDIKLIQQRVKKIVGNNNANKI